MNRYVASKILFGVFVVGTAIIFLMASTGDFFYKVQPIGLAAVIIIFNFLGLAASIIFYSWQRAVHLTAEKRRQMDTMEAYSKRACDEELAEQQRKELQEKK